MVIDGPNLAIALLCACQFCTHLFFNLLNSRRIETWAHALRLLEERVATRDADVAQMQKQMD